MKLCYIAERYRADTREGVELNIMAAKFFGVLVSERGYFPMIPHLNTGGFEHLIGAKDDFYLQGTMEVMRRCDVTFMMPGWMESEGALVEEREAKQIMPIYYDIYSMPRQKGWPLDWS